MTSINHVKRSFEPIPPNEASDPILKKQKIETDLHPVVYQNVTDSFLDALTTAKQIPNGDEQAIAFHLIADSPLLKLVGDQACLHSIIIEEKKESNPETYPLALCSLAKIFALTGHRRRALELVQTLTKNSLNLSKTINSKIFFVLAYLNRDKPFEKNIDPEDLGIKIFKISDDLWIKFSNEEEDIYDLAIQEVSELLIKTNPMQALQKVNLINDPEKRLSLISRIIEQKNVNLVELIPLINRFQNSYYQSKFEICIANQFLKLEMKNEALVFLNQAIEHAYKVTDDQDQCELLVEIVKLQKFVDDAKNVLETLTFITSKIFLISCRASVMIRLVEEFFEIGFTRAALEMLNAATENIKDETNEDYYINLCALLKLQIKIDKNKVLETWDSIAGLAGHKEEVYEILFEIMNNDPLLFKNLYSRIHLFDQFYFLCSISQKVLSCEKFAVLEKINDLKKRINDLLKEISVLKEKIDCLLIKQDLKDQLAPLLKGEESNLKEQLEYLLEEKSKQDPKMCLSKEETITFLVKLAEAQSLFFPHLTVSLKNALESTLSEESNEVLLACFESSNWPIPPEFLSDLKNDRVKVKFFLDNGLKFFESENKSRCPKIEKEEKIPPIPKILEQSFFADKTTFSDLNSSSMQWTKEPSKQGAFERLPNEIKEVVLLQCDLENYLNLQLICNDFKSLATSRYTTEEKFIHFLHRIVDESLSVQDPVQKIEVLSCFAQSPLIELFPEIFSKLTNNFDEVWEGNENFLLLQAVEIGLIQIKTGQFQRASELAEKINSFRGSKTLPSRFEDLLANLKIEDSQIFQQPFFPKSERSRTKIDKKILDLLKKLAESDPEKALNKLSELDPELKECDNYVSILAIANAFYAKMLTEKNCKVPAQSALNDAYTQVELINDLDTQISTLFEIGEINKKTSKKDFFENLFIIQAKLLQKIYLMQRIYLKVDLANIFIPLTKYFYDLNFYKISSSCMSVVKSFFVDHIDSFNEKFRTMSLFKKVAYMPNIRYQNCGPTGVLSLVNLDLKDIHSLAKLARKMDYGYFKTVLKAEIDKIFRERWDEDLRDELSRAKKETIQAIKIAKIVKYAHPKDREEIFKDYNEFIKSVVDCEFLIFDSKREVPNKAIELLDRAFSQAMSFNPIDVQTEENLRARKLCISTLIRIAKEWHHFEPTRAMKILISAFEVTKNNPEQEKLQKHFVEVFSRTNLLFPLKYLDQMPKNSVKMILLNDLAVKLYNRFFGKNLTSSKYMFPSVVQCQVNVRGEK